MKYIFILIAALAVLSGVALRSVEIFNHNYVFVYDQGLDMMAARSISVDHKLTLIGAEAGGGFAGLPGIFHGPGYHYLLAVVSFLSHGDPYGAMVALWVVHMAELWLFFLLGKRLFGLWAGIGAAFVAAVSPVFIGMTRVIWSPNFVGLFVLLYLFVLLCQSHKILFMAFALGLVASMLYHFEIPLAVAAGLSAVCYVWFVERMRDVRAWTLFIVGGVVGFLPMIAFDARHGWTTVHGLIGFLLHPVDITKSAPFDMFGHIRSILFHVSGIFPTIPSLPYWFWFALLSVGLWILLSRDTDQERKRTVTGLFIIAGVHVALFVPYRNPIYGHYLTILSYVIVLVIGYMVTRLQAMRKNWIVAILLCAMAVPSLLLYPRTVIADYRDYGGTAKVKGKIDAIDAIYLQAQGKSFNLLIFTPPVYTYPYDYLLEWYAAPRYGYLPGHEKKGTVFLLIEPDSEKPWSYNGWLETVIKTGIIESTVKLPSGFIIQKRIMEP